MWVPDELGATERWQLRGHTVTLLQRKVSFGPYVTRRVWIGMHARRYTPPTLLNYQREHSTTEQSGWFELTTPTRRLFRGDCLRSSAYEAQHQKSLRWQSNSGLSIGDKVVRARYYATARCTVSSPATERLLLTDGASGIRVEGRERPLTIERNDRGALMEPGRRYRFESPQGFLLKEGDRTVAALDLTTFAESVRIVADLPQLVRDELAAICMALIIAKQLR